MKGGFRVHVYFGPMGQTIPLTLLLVNFFQNNDRYILFSVTTGINNVHTLRSHFFMFRVFFQ
jgi:hypothetical protein